MNATEIYVVAARRTAVGSFGGALKDVPLVDLATLAVSSAIGVAGLDPAHIGQLVMGTVLPTEGRDAYLSRLAAVNAGMAKESVAFNVNRLCGSGMQAIVLAAQAIALGDTEAAIGAGAESMSRSAYLMPALRWGARMGEVAAVDYMNAALHDPFQNISMGITAENVAARHGITREMQDELSAESPRRALAAITEGRFREQITPVELKTRKGTTRFEVDEHPREGVTVETLARMRPVFKADGSVTAGNSSGINDGAAAMVLASGELVKTQGLTPLARLVSWGHAGVEPSEMGIGPVPASRLALARAGLRAADLDRVESNEAFAAQACAVSRQLDLDPARVNVNGSGISLGHPIGATGVVIVTKLIHELIRCGGRRGLATMCIGGGQGIATVWERC